MADGGWLVGWLPWLLPSFVAANVSMPFSLRMLLLLLYADAADAVPCVLWVCMLHTRPSSCASPPGPSFTGSCPTPACCVATAQVCRSLSLSLSLWCEYVLCFSISSPPPLILREGHTPPSPPGGPSQGEGVGLDARGIAFRELMLLLVLLLPVLLISSSL
uniref:Putative secreted protein n=1 Tax=Anopheles darlingi TaxID=43151 RepID=A0A2M4D213_ANODA